MYCVPFSGATCVLCLWPYATAGTPYVVIPRNYIERPLQFRNVLIVLFEFGKVTLIRLLHRVCRYVACIDDKSWLECIYQDHRCGQSFVHRPVDLGSHMRVRNLHKLEEWFVHA